MQKQMMKQALALAKQAFILGEVPIGALICQGEEVIASAHNETERRKDPTAHAELLCIRKAAERLGDWRLNGLTLYTTLEPCSMCAGAILESRLARVVWGAPDLRSGANGSWKNLFDGTFALHQLKIEGEVMLDECAHLMKEFFKIRRRSCLKK